MADGIGTVAIGAARQRNRLTALKSARSSFDPHWKDISEFTQPRSGRFFVQDRNRGGKKNSRIINSKATTASRTLASGMMAGLTSPARPWFRLTTPDPSVAQNSLVKQWLFIVETRMREVFSKSNLYNVLPQLYRELGNYGVAAVAALEDAEEIVRFYPFTIGEYWVATNHKGEVDTFYRSYTRTVAQLVDRYGKERCTPATQKLYENRQFDAVINVIHAVEPNFDRIDGRADALGMAVASYTFEESCSDAGAEDKARYLEIKGFKEFPNFVPRWETAADDEYGTDCPGMIVLGDVKQLQHLELRSGEVIDKTARPPMTGPTSLKNSMTSQLPGDITFVDSIAGQAGFQPSYTPNPNAIGMIEGKIEKIEQRISRVYFEDLFLMLAMSVNRQVTAREVEERHEEKLLMLGPVLERLNDELLDKLIDRTFSIMLRRGLIPEPPEMVQGTNLKIEYISILAQAQKAVGIQGMERFTGFITALAQAQATSGSPPDIADKVNFDAMAEQYAEAIGVAPSVIVDQKAVDKKREQRNQAQQAQQLAASAPAMSKSVKDLADAQVTDDSVLARVAGAAPGIMGNGGG